MDFKFVGASKPFENYLYERTASQINLLHIINVKKHRYANPDILFLSLYYSVWTKLGLAGKMEKAITRRFSVSSSEEFAGLVAKSRIRSAETAEQDAARAF